MISGMEDGMTPWNTICNVVAPVAYSASTQDALTSSIVSMNARVNIPKVAKNKAKKPVRIFCPKEKRRRIAHTTSGTFLKNAANTLTAFPIHGLALVVLVPSRLRKKAHTAEQTVTATDKSVISTNFVSTFGSLVNDFSSGTKFFAIQAIAFGIDPNPANTS